MAAQRLVRSVPVGESVGEAILTLVRAGRPETSDLATVQANVSWGPGPARLAALMLGRACARRDRGAHGAID